MRPIVCAKDQYPEGVILPYSLGIHYAISRLGGQSSLPIILIHGAGGTSYSWPPQLRRLTAHTVLAPDLPSHGKSAPFEISTLDEVATILLDWLNSLGIQQFSVCGHSMGGAIGLLLALIAPQRVRRLILIGSAARLAVNPTLLELSSQASTLPQAVELLIKWSFAPHTPQKLQELTAKKLLENHPQTLFQDLSACNQFDLTASLDHIQQPTLILTGEHDRMTPPQSAQFLAECIPNAQLEIIPNAGHMVVLEQPHYLAQLIRAFCL